MNGETQKMSCAMKVNDVYIEDVIKDYITLGVSGRYDTNAEIESYDLNDDGAIYASHRVKSKTITVYFVVRSKTKSELRKSLNALNGIFRTEQMRLAFDDEPGLFYVGTRATIKYDKILDCDAKGKISIFCADPYKYSVEEFEEFADEDGTITVDYNGTVPFAPVFTAVANSDIGGISLASEAGASIIIGDLEQDDGETVQVPETLVKSNFIMQTGISDWADGTSTTVPTREVGGLYAIAGQTYIDDVGLHADYGTGTHWHGPTYQLAVPADSNGHVGVANFILSLSVDFANSVASGNDQGRIYIQLNSGNSTDGYLPVFRAEVYKPSMPSKTAEIRLLDANADALRTSNIRIDNGLLKDAYLIVSKIGKTIAINASNVSINVDIPDIEDFEVTQVEIIMAAFGTNPTTVIGVKTAQFVKTNVDSWHDLPNTLSAGDTVKVNCEDYTIKINEVSQPKYGDINNDFDGMQLLPGYNSIKCVTNAWVSDKPKFSVKYREVFL